MARLERLFAVTSDCVGAVLTIMNPRDMVVLLIVVLTLETTAEVSSSTVGQPLNSRQIREKTEPSIVYITSLHPKNPSMSISGSGVLMNKAQGLILTNAHLTENSPTVDVVFPAYDAQGDIIRDKQFYNNEIYGKYSILKRQGNITTGRVIWENEDSDLALISVSGALPKTAEQIQYDFEYDYNKLTKCPVVHILGHPSDERGLLWQWDPGHYNSVHGDTLYLDATGWYGGSGGPVTDSFGMLIGLTKSIDRDGSRTYAVSIPPIAKMASKIKQWYVFCIENGTSAKVQYETKWSEEAEWKEDTLEPTGWLPYVIEVDKYYIANPQGGYPRIRYKVTSQAKKEVDGAVSVPTDDTDEADRLVEYKLAAQKHVFGDDIRDRIAPVLDDIVYRFGIKAIGKNGEPEIKLYQRRNMVWIANHTERPVSYTIQWEEGAVNEDRFHLGRGRIKPHSGIGKTFSRISSQSPDYPKIKYIANGNKLENILLSWPELKDMRSYFDMGLDEQEDPSLNAQHPPHPFEVKSDKFFYFTTQSGDTIKDEIKFYKSLDPPLLPIPTSPTSSPNKWLSIVVKLLIFAAVGYGVFILVRKVISVLLRKF